MRTWALFSITLTLAACGAASASPPPVAPAPPPPPAPSAAPALAASSAAPASAPPPDASLERHIDELALSFTLPSAAWKPRALGDVKDAKEVGFERDAIVDDAGNAVKPYVGIIIVPVPKGTDIVQQSVKWRLQVPFSVDKVFSHESGPIQLKNAIGYRGRTMQQDMEHTLFVVHALFRDRGFIVVCDATTSVFPNVQGEFESLLKSMHHTEAP